MGPMQRWQLRVLVAWLLAMAGWLLIRGPGVLPDAAWMTSILVALNAIFWRRPR